MRLDLVRKIFDLLHSIGKTAPRLLLDLARYDPRRRSPDGFNILTDIPFHSNDRDDVEPPLPPRGSCQHTWSLKNNQSELPEDKAYDPSASTSWLFAVCCTLCGSHLDLRISFPSRQAALMPCPIDKRPLHHFIHQPESSKPRRESRVPEDRYGFPWIDIQCFKCTSQLCLATLVIEFKPPRLTTDWIALLTDRYMITSRTERVMARDPEKYEGVAIPSPATVIGNLSSYIENAMYHPETSKAIKKENKRFATCFGKECTGLLEYLGFVEQEEAWIPPKPKFTTEVPYDDPVSILLDDVKQELRGLMAKESIIPIPLAEDEMKAALACAKYRQTPRARAVDLTIDEHPFYAGLGATGDFHDELLGFAYDCQKFCDPRNIPYYLECLQTIAVGRDNSEELQTKAILEESEGEVSLRDIRQAYESLGFNVNDTQLVDDTIIGTFQAGIGNEETLENHRSTQIEQKNRARCISRSVSCKRPELGYLLI